jgi:hypothetical protein
MTEACQNISRNTFGTRVMCFLTPVLRDSHSKCGVGYKRFSNVM